MNIAELRRLEAVIKSPGASRSEKEEARFLIAEALPELLKALETPVAWRTRQRVGPYAPYSWVYTDRQAVTSDDEVYETEPLFGLLPHGGGDVG